VKRGLLPPGEYEWRRDTLRLMLPGRCHSVLLFWDGGGNRRRFTNYFVNMEEPFRRTAIGVDTQDHTLDVTVRPDLSWAWRDAAELENHLKHGFYTAELSEAIRSEGKRAIEAIMEGTHPCLNAWDRWLPDPDWDTPPMPAGWASAPLTFWERRRWAYGDDGVHERQA
jgi:hypothetical protein